MDVGYMDYHKAYDKVLHAMLFWKVRTHRIKDELANCIQNWLGGKMQRVVVEVCYQCSAAGVGAGSTFIYYLYS